MALPTEKKFAILCDLARAQHFAWREAVIEAGMDPREAVLRMWRATGRETGRAYLKRIDRSLPLAPQVARSTAWSSECMGEDAVVEVAVDGTALLRHRACPWRGWHERKGLLEEDRPGCDAWFQSTVDTVNAALGTKLRFETLEALPEGGRACVRRFWEDSTE
jgi:hypothetical protein